MEKGPAKDTNIVSLFRFLKLLGFIGTGLAHPNLNNNKKINPTMSKCLKGLRVNLPEFLAISSPSKYATKPCAHS